MKYTVERFTCDDGDEWYSVVDTEAGDVATGVMHNTEAAADQERKELNDAS